MSRNRYGNFFGYTGLFPILPSNGDGSSPSRDLRRDLATLPNGPGSMFSSTGLVHGARLFVLGNVVFNGHPSSVEHLKHQYLVLSITFDGDLEALLRRVHERSAKDWSRIFRHTWGFPDPTSEDGLIAQVKACQVDTTFLYVDAGADLERTLYALAVQCELRKMVQAGQGKGTEERRALVKGTIARLKLSPPTIPGSFTRKGDGRATRS